MHTLLPITIPELPSRESMLDMEIRAGMRMGAMIHKPAPFALIKPPESRLSLRELKQMYFKYEVLRTDKKKVRGKKRLMRRFDWLLKTE